MLNRDLHDIIEKFAQKIDDDPEKLSGLSEYDRGKQDGYLEVINAIMNQITEDLKTASYSKSDIKDW